ncbi:MAG TPA: Mur ligase family protein [Gaiellaceae bacterium]|nr:Mur ligase family protein [Gaiellaceae bacterium]
MKALLARLGHPERQVQAIHVVGTNGKSTTTRMIEALLLAEGVLAGAYVSPHVVRWSERIRVGGEEADFERAIARIRPAAEEVGATQFEALTAAALAEFAAAGATAAVVEAGLGGRLDATNVLETVAVVLTNVGLEHTNVLGSTREAIAAEKLAVVKPGCGVVLGEPEWEELAREWGAGEVVVEPGGNLALARVAAESFFGFAVDSGPARAVALPGRLEVVCEEPLEIWDGAHNADGVRWLLQELPERDFVLVASILADRDVDEMLRLFSQRASRLVATASRNPRACQADELARRGEPFFESVEAHAEPVTVLERAREVAGPAGAVLVSGSLYLLAELAAVRPTRLPWGRSASE